MNEDIKTPSPAASDNSPATPVQSPQDEEIVVDMSQADEPTKTKDNVVSAKKTRWWKRKLTKKQTIIIAIVAVLLIGGGAAFALTRKKPVQQAATTQAPPKPTTVPSRLTGLPVKPDINKRPVTGVMIENSIFARPQSGLRDAGIVYEAIAEGGITRFLALFQDTTPKYVGPIRSARPYYLEWALPFQASLAHVGGSPDAMRDIQNWHVRNLDQFFNPNSYTRITSREAPHNVYTSLDRLLALEKSKGYKSSSFTSFLRKADGPSSLKTATAKTINFSISGPDYSVKYTWDKKSNSYFRFVGGAKHLDEKSGKQLKPKVVIGLVMSYRIAADGKHSIYGTEGSGPMYIFQDGKVTKGTWKKADKYAQFQFVDSGDKPIALNAGQTWITALTSRSDVSYKP